MKQPDFPRQIHVGDDGTDIYGHKRAMHRYLADGLLDDLEAKPVAVQRHYGEAAAALTVKAQRKARQPQTGVFTERLYDELWRVKAYDAKSANLVQRYNMQHPKLALCFPFPSNVNGDICQGLHETAGIPGNWAVDFCAPPGSPVVAVERGQIWKLSGHDPTDDTWDSQGVFGWSVHFITGQHYHYYATHLGRREVLHVGQMVDVGEPLGFVGDQHYRPDHVHYGVSSPLGEADAKRRIVAVAKAPRVTL